MNKASIMESDPGEEDSEAAPALPPGTRNYMTTTGHRCLKNELAHLVKVERPNMVQVVSWAAGNGDRSENGDYIYGKKRLREIDRRIRFLMKRLDSAVVVDPSDREATDRVFFGATVTVADADGREATWQIVGIDEADAGQGRISWVSPLAGALLKSREGDRVRFRSPAGPCEMEIVEVRYDG
ncbi:MAG: transcription elongation factor GreB [Rhodocyclaceae bacterium]|nr:transcription elongation factor GreB [Rhodocyclaceae bacterium]